MGIYHCSYSRILEPEIYSYVYKSDGFSLTPKKTKCFFPNGPITWTISLDRMIQENKEYIRKFHSHESKSREN